MFWIWVTFLLKSSTAYNGLRSYALIISPLFIFISVPQKQEGQGVSWDATKWRKKAKNNLHQNHPSVVLLRHHSPDLLFFINQPWQRHTAHAGPKVKRPTLALSREYGAIPAFGFTANLGMLPSPNCKSAFTLISLFSLFAPLVSWLVPRQTA